MREKKKTTTAIAIRREERALSVAVSQAIDEGLRTLSVKPGVTRGYLQKQASELALSEGEVEAIMTIREKHNAGIPSVMKRIRSGMTGQEVLALYELKAEITSDGLSETENPSIGMIQRYCEIFRSEDPEEDPCCGEHLAEVLARLRELMPYLKYTDTLIAVLCEVAENFRLADVETALDAIQSRRDLAKNSIGDDEENPHYEE